MRKFLKYSLICGVIIAICWVGAVAFWRYQGASPSNTELALWLVALPLVLLAGLFLLIKRANAKSKKKEADADGTAESQDDQASTNFSIHEMVLLAWNSVNRLSDNTTSTLAALPEAPGLDLDKELTDDSGFPIMTARVADLDTQSLRDALNLNANPTARSLDDHVLRATALLQRACEPLLLQVHAFANQAQQEDWSKHLNIICYSPPDWPDEAVSYLHTEISTWAHNNGLPDIQIHAAKLPEQDPLLQRFPMLGKESEAYAEIRGLTLILSCASDLSRQAVSNLSIHGQLYTSMNPKGLPPGEGATAILAAHPQQADLQTGLQASVQLASLCKHLFWPVALPSQENDAPAIISADAAMPSLIKAVKVQNNDVSYMVIHNKLDKPSMNHAFGFIQRQFPDLDTETGLSLTGSSLGSLGGNAAWQLAALAAEKTQQSKQPSCFYTPEGQGMSLGMVVPLEIESA